jgi:methionine-R-sulfoxide reductase
MNASWALLAVGALALVGALGLTMVGNDEKPDPRSPKRKDKVVRTDEGWRKLLTPEQYRILRGHGTERAFCSPLHDNKRIGVYHCVGCDLPLFRSEAKFQSSTGWPSFFQPASKDAIWTRTDTSFGMVRSEVLCARCDGHLGHVFDDGPKPSGLRYCINGEVLKFKEAK